jgi:hypothetical protein
MHMSHVHSTGLQRASQTNAGHTTTNYTFEIQFDSSLHLRRGLPVGSSLEIFLLKL